MIDFFFSTDVVSSKSFRITRSWPDKFSLAECVSPSVRYPKKIEWFQSTCHNRLLFAVLLTCANKKKGGASCRVLQGFVWKPCFTWKPCLGALSGSSCVSCMQTCKPSRTPKRTCAKDWNANPSRVARLRRQQRQISSKARVQRRSKSLTCFWALALRRCVFHLFMQGSNWNKIRLHSTPLISRGPGTEHARVRGPLHEICFSRLWGSKMFSRCGNKAFKKLPELVLALFGHATQKDSPLQMLQVLLFRTHLCAGKEAWRTLPLAIGGPKQVS